MKKASGQLGSGCPPWKPDCPGAPSSYRVELIGVTPLWYPALEYHAKGHKLANQLTRLKIML
jgi:hypothetical protein